MSSVAIRLPLEAWVCVCVCVSSRACLHECCECVFSAVRNERKNKWRERKRSRQKFSVREARQIFIKRQPRFNKMPHPAKVRIGAPKATAWFQPVIPFWSVRLGPLFPLHICNNTNKVRWIAEGLREPELNWHLSARFMKLEVMV